MSEHQRPQGGDVWHLGIYSFACSPALALPLHMSNAWCAETTEDSLGRTSIVCGKPLPVHNLNVHRGLQL